MSLWQSALELSSDRNIIAGSEADLADAIRQGADLRIYTEFIYNEHIDIESDNDELVREVSEFGVTYLLNDSWSAGIMSLRQPIVPPLSFGPRPSMSFFIYNQNGQQAIGRPYLDGVPAEGVPGLSPVPSSHGMKKYLSQEGFDQDTNAPSSNFIYDFEVYRFYVNNSWREVLSHDESGEVIFGSIEELADAFSLGSEIKIGVHGLCGDMGGDGQILDHEVFVQAGPGYYNTRQKLFTTGSHPVVRVCPATPLVYSTQNWDFGWIMARTDGQIQFRRCDPFSLKFEDRNSRHAIRWFVRN